MLDFSPSGKSPLLSSEPMMPEVQKFVCSIRFVYLEQSFSSLQIYSLDLLRE